MHALRQCSTDMTETWLSIAQVGPGGLGKHVATSRTQTLQRALPFTYARMRRERLARGHQF
ncbi:MAG: hypothetical protein PVSMB5_01820 [Ktedonobacteraceae bacterium]